MKRLIITLAIAFSAAFGIALAFTVGHRIPSKALPIIAGAIIGAGVAIPSTLLFAGILTSDNLHLSRPSSTTPATYVYIEPVTPSLPLLPHAD